MCCHAADSDLEDSITVDLMEQTHKEDIGDNVPLLSPTGVHPSQIWKATQVSEDSESHLSNLNFVDGLEWNIDEDSVQMDLNGRASNTTWLMCDTFRTTHSAGSNVNGEMSHMDYLMLMFPPFCCLTHCDTDKCKTVTNARPR